MKTTTIFILLLLVTGFLVSCQETAQKPNIVFIMSDDHAEKAISAYDSSLIQTPNIDRIANEGIRFENSFVTNSICAPSRAVMLTGKYSHKNGLRDNRDEFDGSQMTFPKLLQKAGYQTAIVGKWHLKSEPTGFDLWRILIGQGQYYNPDFIEQGTKKKYEGYTTDIITDLALEELSNRDPEKPFCLLLHHKAPHRNWMPNLKHLDLLKDKDFPIPPTLYDDYQGRPAAEMADMRIDDMYLSGDFKLQPEFYEVETGTGGKVGSSKNAENRWQNTYNRLTAEQKSAWDAHYNKINEQFKSQNLKGKDLLNWKYQQYMKDYLRCIISVDENVGRVLDYLDKHGLAENTIVIYTSDQGFYLGEHGWYDKRFIYEESLSMPLMVRYPKSIKSGQINTELVLNLDFAPTFLEYAGVNVPAEMQGASLRPLLENQTVPDWRQSIYYRYYEYPHGWHDVNLHYGVRTKTKKLIHFYGHVDSWEYYDLQSDPDEMNNRCADPSAAADIQVLKAELKRLQKFYQDTSLVVSD